MPTGYTCIIEDRDDVTFREYALRCARAFGACVMQRDEDMDALPRHREPSDWNAKRLMEAEGRIVELTGISDASADALWRAEVASLERSNREFAERLAVKQERYARMRAQVAAYVAPTPEHVKYREFMLEQIDLCYRPDEKPYQCSIPASASEYVAHLLDGARRDVEYHTKGHADEMKRCAEANAWIDALVASLPNE